MYRHDQSLPETIPNTSTAHDRCAFLRTAGEIAVNRAGVRLNLKILYQSQGQAIEELLKLALPLAAATEPGNQVAVVLVPLDFLLWAA